MGFPPPSGGGVASVFTRTGAVTASAGDYNYSQITASANAVAPSNITGGLAGQVLGGTAPGYVYPPGTQLDYAQITSNSAAITATTSATAQAVVTGNAVTYDGTSCFVEFFADFVQGGSTRITFVLYDGSTELGRPWRNVQASFAGPVYWKTQVTPSAGSHTYSCKAYVDAGSGVIEAGNNSINNPVPAWIRVTKA